MPPVFAGVRECRRRFPTERLVLLWLGSSVGNSSQEEAVQFFRDVMAAAGAELAGMSITVLIKQNKRDTVLPLCLLWREHKNKAATQCKGARRILLYMPVIERPPHPWTPCRSNHLEACNLLQFRHLPAV